MANIKFSQFTVGNTESDIDFVVGYKGANNIQISPANLLSATLAGYLPLTGGTMSGNVVFTDNTQARFGTGSDLRLQHSSGNNSSYIQNYTGDLYIENLADDKDIIFKSDDGSGGLTQYFRLDGGFSSPQTIFPDNSQLNFGSGLDLRIRHNGTDSTISVHTGNLNIIQTTDDADISFQCDDGSGGHTEYFRLDGGLEKMVSSKHIMWLDDKKAQFGDSNDLQIYHDSFDGYIENFTNHLRIRNQADDGDIKFFSDDGSGGITEYFRVDGGDERVLFSKEIRTIDNVKIQAGTGGDLKIYHDSSNSYIQAEGTGDLVIEQKTDDKDILFKSDNGSGGVTTYFSLDGSIVRNKFSKSLHIPDNVKAEFGANNDLQIYHDGSSSQIDNYTGNLLIKQRADDADIIFYSDDGSGNIAEYFRLDGSAGSGGYLYTSFPDQSTLSFGNSLDFNIFHFGNTFLNNETGDLYITNSANDKDILFRCDDGSGGVTEYFRLDGSLELNRFFKSTLYNDNIRASFGVSSDMQIYHGGTNSVIDNLTGDLIITNFQDDGNIIFKSDDGSGGVTEYFRLDGSSTYNIFSKDLYLIDNATLRIGTGQDLRIYHDGSNSFIQDVGTGNLNIQGDNLLLKRADGSQTYLQALTGSSVSLYHAGNKKLETTSTGVKITGVSEYADNTAAIAGGLTTGDVYRTGDLLKIVH